MTLVAAALLGLLQGLTEFLPVSSSAHLVLAGTLLDVRLPGAAFEVVVHVATLGSVLWVYRRRVAELAVGVLAGRREALAYTGLLALATVPAATAGLLGEARLAALFDQPLVAAAALLVTGGAVWSIRTTAPRAREPRPGTRQALWMGLAQALAIVPGLSRSGLTVAVGAWRGVDAVRAAEFSFLLSIPAILGAGILQADEVAATLGAVGAAPLAVGFAAAFVTGVAAITLFVRLLRQRRFHVFAWYCWTVGLAWLAGAVFLPGLRG
ncbi:MAG: undecaprenyl-diphosphate phosphatase [Gemmatimonadota bacterium]|nr:undecaprenyl-diphosphate phosphatase [Gemmatimonadota bacterium]